MDQMDGCFAFVLYLLPEEGSQLQGTDVFKVTLATHICMFIFRVWFFYPFCFYNLTFFWKLIPVKILQFESPCIS